MPYKEFEENLKLFKEMINHISSTQNEQLNSSIKRYIEQNISILNDIFTASIENLERLEKAKDINDIICLQAKFTSDMNKKLALAMQRFFNASLGHAADYNEWLKTHCDLATD